QQAQGRVDQRIAVRGLELAVADRDRRTVSYDQDRIGLGVFEADTSGLPQVERALHAPPVGRKLREPALNALDRVQIIRDALQISLLDIRQRYARQGKNLRAPAA